MESFQLTPESGQSSFGYAIATGADIGEDGVIDLVVGAYGGSAGSISVFDSRTRYWQQDNSPPLQVINGLDTGDQPGDTHADQFGVSLAMGHLDGDGYADVAVGANRAGIEDQGQIHILRGAADGRLTDTQQEAGGTARDLLGHYLAIPGDVDGDGIDDIAGGASNQKTAQNPNPRPGHVLMFYHDFKARNPSEDPDHDGVRALVDNCANEANTSQADLDGDGVGDACDPDADGDTMDDEWETRWGLNRLDASDTAGDADGDGASNLQEFIAGTEPGTPDTDRDGIPDGVDPDPLVADTDGDGVTNEDDPDDDADGLPDEFELANFLNPVDASDALADTDGDQFSNLAERQAGSSVNDPDSKPGDAVSDSLFAAVLPGHRTTRIGNTVTAFATIINANDERATDCSLVPAYAMPGTYGFAATDPATNAISGDANAPASIDAGGAQSFVFAVTPAEAQDRIVTLRFDCADTDPVAVLARPEHVRTDGRRRGDARRHRSGGNVDRRRRRTHRRRGRLQRVRPGVRQCRGGRKRHRDNRCGYRARNSDAVRDEPGNRRLSGRTGASAADRAGHRRQRHADVQPVRHRRRSHRQRSGQQSHRRSVLRPAGRVGRFHECGGAHRIGRSIRNDPGVDDVPGS